MQIGHHRRHTESTDANDTSSRSHALCLVRLSNGGKLVLVDCAGSERRKDSMYHTKERQVEGAQINASLHALKECEFDYLLVCDLGASCVYQEEPLCIGPPSISKLNISI